MVLFFFSWEVQAAQANGREHMAPMEAVREIKDNGTGNIIGVRGVVSTRVAYIRGACSVIILEPVRERYIHITRLVRRVVGRWVTVLWVVEKGYRLSWLGSVVGLRPQKANQGATMYFTQIPTTQFNCMYV